MPGGVDKENLANLLNEIRGCRICTTQLPNPPRPIVRASATAGLLIIGQAPGRKVQETGIPWNDASGKRLREWLQVDDASFYDEQRVALVPMGFCYPGKGTSGDLPPRPECAPLWHPRLLAALPEVRLTLLIGAYAQARYLGAAAIKAGLTETVAAYREHLSRGYFVLPHPSPRNQGWLKQNPWFELEALSELRLRVAAALAD
ncbi:MAG: uracil-DNA glycosylase family protein [Nevskia sp.]